MIIRYKRRALRDIERIHDYIAEHDALAARSVVRRIEHSISRLAFLPLSGRPGVVAGTRIVVVPGLPYVAIYRVREEAVEIITVLHTARRRRS
jgi:addiction module RelE/StbE family toxin